VPRLFELVVGSCPALNTVAQPGVNAPVCTHYGILKTFPFWEPLRGDPRFEKIVASLAPKQLSELFG